MNSDIGKLDDVTGWALALVTTSLSFDYHGVAFHILPPFD
jgi:hypothetical protein